MNSQIDRLGQRLYTCHGARGYIQVEGRYYRAQEVADYFARASSWSEFLTLAREARGEWCVDITVDEERWMAVDVRSSQRLYYATDRSGVVRSADSGYALLDGLGRLSWNEEAVLFFLRWGFTPEHHTLLGEVSRIPPASALRIDAGGTQHLVRYTPTIDYLTEDELSYEDAKAGLRQHLDQAGERLVRYLDGRTAIIPLTGGYDSRMIAYQLHRLRYPHVVAINYGMPGNRDAVRGEEIARRLGIEYHFIPSIRPTDGSYIDDTDYHDYMRYLSGLSSCYYYQEYRPAQWLADTLGGGVVLPGHQGDDLGGSQLIRPSYRRGTVPRAQVARHLAEHMGWHQDYSRDVRQRLVHQHEALLASYPEGLAEGQYIELFMQYERIAKYNLNSQASWRYYGFDTAGMMLDQDLANYAYSLSLSYRYGKRLHEDLCGEIWRESGLSLPGDARLIDLIDHPWYKLKQVVKPFVRRLMPSRGQDLFAGESLIGFAQVMEPLLEAVRRDGRWSPTSINGLSFAWYLLYLEQYLDLPLPSSLCLRR